MTLLDHRNTATTKKLDFKNSHITSVGAKIQGFDFLVEKKSIFPLSQRRIYYDVTEILGRIFISHVLLSALAAPLRGAAEAEAQDAANAPSFFQGHEEGSLLPEEAALSAELGTAPRVAPLPVGHFVVP
jgi:hypothetical protein